MPFRFLFTMNVHSASSEVSLLPTQPGCACRKRTVDWGAILAGTSAALALQVVFMFLGAGLGFALYTPITDANPVADLGRGALVIQGISAVFSLWLGGWVAGRLTPIGARLTGWLHGFGVWCTATVVAVIFVSLGAGWALGDLSKVVGGGLALTAKPAAALAGEAAGTGKDALKQTSDALASFTDEAVGLRPSEANANGNIRAKREVGLALATLFNPANQGRVTANRAALVNALVTTVGLREADAEKLLTEWTTTYERLSAELSAAKTAMETKAREAADKAADVLAILSLCAFAGFALGAVAASHGGRHGAQCAVRCESRTGEVTG